MSRDIGKIVEAVLEKNPLPDDYRDLVPAQRRRIEEGAGAANMTPERYWGEVRAGAAAERKFRREASGVAYGVRTNMRRVD